MAFNPFTSFRKYQKFWMATILLLCMVTFVLCSNIAGESNWLLDLFRPRSGKVMAKIDGRSIYDSDLHALKEQRQLADKFMRKACDILDKKLEAVMMDKEKKLDQKDLAEITHLVVPTLRERLRQKHYFETGTSFDDLIDFLVWRNEADRLGINLVEKAVEQMFNDEVFFPRYFGQDDAQHTYAEVRGGNRTVSWRNIMGALRDEFRVSIAKLAVARAQVNAYETRGKINPALKIYMAPETRISPTPYELWELYRKDRQEYEIALLPISAREFLPTLTYLGQVLPLPEESELQKLFDARKDKQYNPSLPESGFESPHQVKIEVLTADPHSKFYQDPAKLRMQLELAVFGIDGKTPLAWPVWNFGGSWVSNVARFGAADAAMNARLELDYAQLRANAFKKWQEEGKAKGSIPYVYFRSTNDLPAFTSRSPDAIAKVWPEVPTQNVAWPLYWQYGKDRAECAASLVAGLTADPLGVAAVARLNAQVKVVEKDYAAVIKDERKSRAMLAARMVGGAAAPGLAPLDYAAWRGEFPRVFPLEQVKQEVVKNYVDRLATEAVQQNMRKVRDELERIQDNPNLVERAPRFIDDLVKKYGLIRYVTKPSPYSRDGLYDRFTIHLAPELKDFKDAYLKYFPVYNLIEGRSSNEDGYLKDDQFYRLFFDNQKFSAGQGLFLAKPWPPDVSVNRNPRRTVEPMDQDPRAQQSAVEAVRKQEAVDGKDVSLIRLFNDAEKPMLFYKSQERQSSLPDKMDSEARARVLATWRLEKARDDLALPRAADIAKKLRETPEAELDAAIRAEAAKLGPLPGKKEQDRVVRFPTPKKTPLEDGVDPFARLIKFHRPGGIVGYGEFRIRKDDFEYPRNDMVAQLQTLVDGQKAVEISVKPLDDINKKLLALKGKMGVQILANQPRTTYYVAVVTRKLDLNRDEFVNAYRKGWRATEQDEFITRAQADLSKQFMADLMAQLRVLREVTIDATEEDRKGFRDN